MRSEREPGGHQMSSCTVDRRDPALAFAGRTGSESWESHRVSSIPLHFRCPGLTSLTQASFTVLNRTNYGFTMLNSWLQLNYCMSRGSVRPMEFTGTTNEPCSRFIAMKHCRLAWLM